MLRSKSAVAALLLVLLPIGGMTVVGSAGHPAAADGPIPPGAIASGPIPTPAAMVVVCLGAVGLAARCLASRFHRRPTP